jgi:uncharacterized protein YfaS (alpha-2-macroglobulin family)
MRKSLAAPLWTACVLFAVILAGCGRDAAPPPVAAPPAATRASSPSQEFELLQAGSETYNGRPALKLQFSQPLAAAQTFDQLLAVTNAEGAPQTGSWVLDEDNRSLRFPFVQANQTYKVSIKAALAAADGRSLGDQAPREVFSGDLPPAVGFASQGSVLPARDSDGLPIISVNVKEVDVEFLRVRDASLSQFFTRFLRQEQRSYWEMDDLTAIADPVYANRFALEAAPNQRGVSFLPVQTIPELREPGLYFAILKRPGVFDGQLEASHFYVGDLGLHARLQGESLWLHAASLADGEARSSVAVQVLDKNGLVLVQGDTDAEGDLTLAYKPQSEHVLLARSGSEIALIPFRQPALDLSEFPITGRKQTAQDVYAWSGRDLYRPGEPLQVSALLRDHDGRALSDALPLYATLRQPDGRAISTVPLQAGALGYYSYQRTLAADASTGKWSVEYRVDPAATEALGRFAFRIEEFLPERLKLALDSPSPTLTPGEALELQIDADYLYGAPAAGNRFTADVIYRNAQHAVPAFKDYFFGDPTLELPKEPQSVIDATLGDDGTLVQSIDLLPDGPAVTAPVEVLVAGSVFESGGRAVRRSLTRTIWPADALVGARPLFDPEDGADANSTAGFEIVRSDASGKLTAAAALEVTLVRELRDYHWTWNDGQGWRSDYTQRFETIEQATLALDGSKPGRYEARVEWGEYRLEIKDPDTGLTLRYPFTAGWSWNDDNRGVDARPEKVKLALDKTSYAPGDVLKVTLTAPFEGPGVLLVESDKLLYRTEVEARVGASYEIPIEKDWLRHDVYITALVFRPAGSDAKSGPGRAIGVVHVPMAGVDRTASLALEAPEISRPGDPIRITLNAPEFAGKSAHAVVEAVDLGIINLSNYPLPDAADYFLAQRALGIEAWDLYGRVIERLQGERARLRFGGDAALAALPQARRPTARVKTVALHHAPVEFDAQGQATVTFTAPEFNGALRVAALAYSADRYAKASVESIVRAPLVLEVSTPRALAPGDRSHISVDLHNLSGAASKLTVRAQAQAPLSVQGAAQVVELADNQRRTLNFPLSALPGFGVGKFQVSAESANGKLEREYEIAVRPAWPSLRRSEARVIEQTQTLSFGTNLFEGLMPGSGKALISISSTPPLPFAASIKGLIGYPYGCIEQTSSRLWPLLWMDDATAGKFGLSPLPAAERLDMIDAGFNRLAAMQLESGHFAYWPGEGYPMPQLTPYIADLLLSAQQAGHTVPQAVLDKAMQRLNDDLLTGGEGYYDYEYSEHLRFAGQAYAGYVLAKANRAPLGTLRSLYENERSKSITALPLVHLGLALKLQGDAARGEAAIEEALGKKGKRPAWLGDYGSRTRDDALILALLHEHQIATPKRDERVLTLARELRKPDIEQHWLSTQEQLAIFRLGRSLLGGDARGLQGELSLGGEKVEAMSGRPMFAREFGVEELRRGVNLSLEGAGPFWLAQDVVGTPTRAPAVEDDPVRIRRAWYRTDGKLFEGGRLKEGETLVAKLTIEAKEEMRDALVVDLLPAGIEIENLALGDRGALGELVLDGITLNQREYSAEIRHEEFLDDRYVAAVKLYGGSPAHLFYLIRAVSPGTFVVPPPMVEDMYRPRLRGLGQSIPQEVEVTPP